MRRMLLALAAATLLLVGCSDRAEELYSTAQLEEKQYQTDHARELYRQIVEKYPDSPYAEKARQRLDELQQDQ